MKLPNGLKLTPERTLHTEIRYPDGSLKARWAHAVVFTVSFTGSEERHLARCAMRRERRRRQRR